MKALLARVDEVLTAEPDPARVLAILRDTLSLRHLLESITTDPQRLSTCADASYRHPNGFDKIVLASPSDSPLKMVLHLWNGDEEADDGHIHNHRWNFASIVLSGALQLELYKPDSTGYGYSKMKYKPLTEVRAYQLRPSGLMKASAQAAATLAAGSTYTWAAKLLHRAWALPGQNTLTLIVQGPPIRKRTTVLVDSVNSVSRDVDPRLAALRADDLGNRLAYLATSGLDAAWYSRNNAELISDSCSIR